MLPHPPCSSLASTRWLPLSLSPSWRSALDDRCPPRPSPPCPHVHPTGVGSLWGGEHPAGMAAHPFRPSLDLELLLHLSSYVFAFLHLSGSEQCRLLVLQVDFKLLLAYSVICTWLLASCYLHVLYHLSYSEWHYHLSCLCWLIVKIYSQVLVNPSGFGDPRVSISGMDFRSNWCSGRIRVLSLGFGFGCP
jgi:hypothetical protein